MIEYDLLFIIYIFIFIILAIITIVFTYLIIYYRYYYTNVKIYNKYFSKSYEESEHKIINANFKKKFKLHTNKYFTLFTRINKKSNNYIISTSGIHGNEHITGNAIQVKFLKELNNTCYNENMPNIIIIHNVNKFGCINSDRFNSNNVDLNRNNINFNIKLNNKLYDMIKKVFNPNNNFEYCIQLIMILFTFMKYGKQNVLTCLLAGQYTDKNNIYFGGKEHQNELINMFEILGTIIKENSNVYHLDIHTGFVGYLKEFIMVDNNNTKNNIKNIFNINNNNSVIVDLSSNLNYKLCTGVITYTDNFKYMLKKYGKIHNINYTGICHEFGIADAVGVPNYVVVSLKFFQYNYYKKKNKLTERIKTNIMNLYNPPTTEYQAFTIEKGFTRLIELKNYLEHN